MVVAEAARRTLKGTISPSPEIIADIARSSSNFTFAMFSKHFLRWGCTRGTEWGEGDGGGEKVEAVEEVEAVGVGVAAAPSHLHRQRVLCLR